jgi:hypothetical protein
VQYETQRAILAVLLLSMCLLGLAMECFGH